MVCERCGGPINPDTNICSYCGAWNGRPKSNRQEEKPEVKPAKKNPYGTLVIWLAVAAGVIGFILITAGVILQFRGFSLIWAGGTLITLALVIPGGYFAVLHITNSLKNITKDVSAAPFNIFNSLGGQTANTAGKLSYEAFSKIRLGTTIEQVKTLLGEGKETYSFKSGSSEIKIMAWHENPASILRPAGKTVTIKFQDGRTVEKSQSGL